jgi:uncharacterized protein
MKVLLDTNVLIRWMTNDDPKKASAVDILFKKATKGDVVLHLADPCIAEITWVLESVYRMSRSAIASLLETLISSPGLNLENPERVANAVAFYGAHDIDFVDAYLAAQAQAENLPLLSYDADFDALPVKRIEP